MPMSYYLSPHGVTSQYRKPPQDQALQRKETVPYNHQVQRQTRWFDRKHLQCDQIHMTYAQLLPYLVQKGLIETKEIPPDTFPYHVKHNPNAPCAYHDGHKGHSIGDC